MPEPFGRRNRRVDVKPVLKKKRVHAKTRIRARPPPSETNAKLYLYLAGGVLFLIMAGFAFA
jgi:hypothetical protein